MDSREDALAMKQLEGLTFPVLYDTDHAVGEAWGVYNLLNDGVNAPSTFILNRDGEVVWSYIGKNTGDRPTAAQLMFVLRDLQAPA